MLKYIGRGNFLLQVPARDLTEDEIKGLKQKFAWRNLRKTLIDSGLYEEMPDKAPKKVGDAVEATDVVKSTKKRKKEAN